MFEVGLCIIEIKLKQPRSSLVWAAGGSQTRPYDAKLPARPLSG